METPSKKSRRSSDAASRDSLQLYLETSEELDTTSENMDNMETMENMENMDENGEGEQKEEAKFKGSDDQKEEIIDVIENDKDDTKGGENEDENNKDMSFKKADSTSQPKTITTTSPGSCVSCGATVRPGFVALHPQLNLPTCDPCLPRLLAMEGAEVAASTCRCCGLVALAPYTCSSCPAGFCGQCLARVLGRAFLQLAGSHAWRCLLCDRRPLSHSRLAGGGGGRGKGRGVSRGRGAATTRPPAPPAPLACRPPPQGLQHMPSPRGSPSPGCSPSPMLRSVPRGLAGRTSPHTSPSPRHRVAPSPQGFHPRVLFPPSPAAALAGEAAMPRLLGVTIYRVDKVAESREVAREVAAVGHRLTEAAAEVEDTGGEELVEVLDKALADAATKVQELRKKLRKE